MPFSPGKLRSLRESRGLSRELVAVRAERSYSSILSYELGRITPSTDALERLALALDVEISALFEDEVVPS